MSLTVTISSGSAMHGDLCYVTEDHAFNFLPTQDTAELEARIGTTGTASLAFGTLQIELGRDQGILLYPWGFCPKTSWIRGSVRGPVNIREGILMIERSQIPPRGVAFGVGRAQDWKAVWDRSTGWLLLGDNEGLDHHVEFAERTVAGIQAGQMTSLWLRPRFLED